jgi:hypothetical protein
VTGYDRLVGVNPDNALASVIHGHLGATRESWIPSESWYWLSSGNVRTLYWWDGTNDRAVVGVDVSTGSVIISTPAYFSEKIHSRNGGGTITVDSTSYISDAAFIFYHDYDAFAFTHYRIVAYGVANEAGQTVTLQLATPAASTTPIHTGGNDLVMTDALGAVDSGWLTRDVAASGFTAYAVALKGSNATVDLSSHWVQVHMKIA